MIFDARVVAQSCLTVCDPMDCNLPGSSDSTGKNTVMGCSPGDLPDPGIEPVSLKSSALAGGFFTTDHLESLSQAYISVKDYC